MALAVLGVTLFSAPAVSAAPDASNGRAVSITAVSPGRLSADEQLTTGQQVASSNGKFRLVLDAGGQIAMVGPIGPIWGVGSTPVERLVMQGDGNLVAYRWGNPVWHSRSHGNPGAWLAVQDDGNLVVYRTNGTVAWASSGDPNQVEAFDDRLLPGERLDPGGSLLSAGGTHELVMQGDGNLVVYNDRGPVWATYQMVAGTSVTMQRDGNLVSYTPFTFHGAALPLWTSGTGAPWGAVTVLQDDGNLVVYRPDGTPLWASWFSRGTRVTTDTLSAGQRLAPGQSLLSARGLQRAVLVPDGPLLVAQVAPNGPGPWESMAAFGGAHLVMRPDGNVVLTTQFGFPAWNSGTGGNPGARLVMQDDGNLVVYRANGTAAWSSKFSPSRPPRLWSTGPWW